MYSNNGNGQGNSKSKDNNGNAYGKGNDNGNSDKADIAGSIGDKNTAIREKISDIISNKSDSKTEGNKNKITINGYKILLEKSYLNDFSINLENLQNKATNIKKNIKISNENDKKEIKDEYVNIKNNIDKLESDNLNFLNNVEPEEKKLIIDQNESIKKSINNLQKLLISVNKESIDAHSNEELFNKTVDIEKEIKNISRQYRAIDWILFEQ
jgi:hypothetical protein